MPIVRVLSLMTLYSFRAEFSHSLPSVTVEKSKWAHSAKVLILNICTSEVITIIP